MATPNTSFHDPGSYNVFIPAATSKLQVEFSRNPTSFPLAQYMQIVPNQAVAGLYPELSSSDPVTVVTQADNLWPDGQERPKGRLRPFRWKEWRSERRTYGYTLGSLTVDQARFDVVAAHGRGSAATAMTDRTLDANTVLTTTANWPSANISATIDSLIAGTSATWTSTTATLAINQFIKKGFNAVKQTIAKQTGGVVQPGQLMCIINPVAASNMAATEEIREYLVNHDASLGVQSQESRFIDNWGLPKVLYGVEMVVEDSVRQTTRRNMDGTGTISYIPADNDAFFLSKVGGLIGAGSPNQTNAAPTFTTLTGFFHEEMSVETEVDGWNRLTKGGVTDTRDIVLTAPSSGLYIQDITS